MLQQVLYYRYQVVLTFALVLVLVVNAAARKNSEDYSCWGGTNICHHMRDSERDDTMILFYVNEWNVSKAGESTPGFGPLRAKMHLRWFVKYFEKNRFHDAHYNYFLACAGSLQESSEGNMSLQQRNSAAKRAGATQITRILIIEPGPRTQPYSDDDHVDKVLRSLEVGDVEQEIG